MNPHPVLAREDQFVSGTTLCTDGKNKLMEEQLVTKKTLLALGSFYNKWKNPIARKWILQGFICM